MTGAFTVLLISNCFYSQLANEMFLASCGLGSLYSTFLSVADTQQGLEKSLYIDNRFECAAAKSSLHRYKGLRRRRKCVP